jgi:hypothetical protein
VGILRKRLEPDAAAIYADVPDMLVAQYMQRCAELIVQQGGDLASDSTGASIYPGRADLHLTTSALDMVLRRYVKVRVRLRVTVEAQPFET